MSDRQAQRDELFDLCSAMCDGTATPADVARLEQLLVDDPTARDLYVQYMSLHAGLKWSRSSAAAADDAQVAETSAVGVRKGHRWRALRDVFTRPLPLSVTVAALVMGVLVAAMAIIAVPMVVNYARNGFEAQPPIIVARLTNTADAEWSQGQVGTLIGSHLVAGHSMALQRGRAEVTFDDGAIVWLEGPCEFQVVSSNAAALQRGTVNARVNETARGFTLATPLAQIVDMGTAFGVRATVGGTEVQVYQGVVDVLIAETAQRRTLRAGESLHVRSGGKVSPSAGDMRIALPGFRVPLGNLFDDAKGTPLRRAVASDQFGATADPTDLGVHHMLAGTDETVVALHEKIRFDLAELGWSREWYSPPANDAWKPDASGISTSGEAALEKRKYGDGIGIHANQLVTFDLEEIRAAGEFSRKAPRRLAIARMGANRDREHNNGECSLHVVVIVSSESQVLAGWVNGQRISVAREGDFWQFTGVLPAWLSYESQHASLDEMLPADARFVTLACTGAGVNSIHSDHGVFSPCVLEFLPEPLAAVGGETSQSPDEPAAPGNSLPRE